jgi:hypothetical protein
MIPKIDDDKERAAWQKYKESLLWSANNLNSAKGPLADDQVEWAIKTIRKRARVIERHIAEYDLEAINQEARRITERLKRLGG